MVSANSIVANAVAAYNTTGGALFKCKRCGATGNPYDGFCRTCGYLLPKDEMSWRADELIARELRKTTPRGIKGLAYIRGIGRIDLEIGKRGIGAGRDYGFGLSKLIQKHAEELPYLGMTLVLGRTYNPKEEEKLVRVRGDYIAALGKRDKGASLITHYKEAKKAASYG